MEILYKDKNLIAINKPAGIPTQPDPSSDLDAMTLSSDLLMKDGEKNTELYLVHRLDRVVGGVLVFARNKSSAAHLSALMAERSSVEKEYLAVVDGEAAGGILTDYLYKDARAGKSFVVDRKRAGVKEASLEYSKVSVAETSYGTKTLIKVKLHTGRFHQIRAQLSSRKMPIVGDGKYGSKDNKSKFPSLFAFRVAFEMDGKKYEFVKMPEKENYPWSLFNYDREALL